MNVHGQLEYAQLHNLSSDPTPVSTGQIYFNTVSLFGKLYNGTAWKSLVDDNSVQTLSSKILDAAKIDDYLLFTETSSPATPSAGFLAVFAKNTHQLWTKDSNGTEAPIGSGGGSGEVNYVTNPSAEIDLTGWGTSGAGVTLARTSNAAELPRASLTDHGIKITCVSGTSDYVYYRFTMGAADKAKKMRLAWAQFANASFATGDLVVEMWTNSASNYGGSYTQLTVQDPNVNSGTYAALTTVDTTTADYYELRFRIASGTSFIVLSDVLFGPGTIASVPVVGDSKLQTAFSTILPVGVWGTTSNERLVTKRVGDSLQGNFTFTMGVPVASAAHFVIPENLSLDVNFYTDDVTVVGRWHTLTPTMGSPIHAYNASGFSGVLIATADNKRIYFALNSDNSGWTVINAAAIGGTNVNLALEFDFRVTEYVSSGVFSTNTAVEYAFNDATVDNDDHVTFGYGSQGSEFPPLTSAHDRWVKFRTPIMPSDIVFFQWTNDGGITWKNVEGGVGIVDAYTIVNSVQQYGANIQNTIDPYTVNVLFGSYPKNNAATYGGAGTTAWSSIAGNAAYRWRAVKCSNPIGLGHGLVSQNNSGLVASAGQLKGTNTNDDALVGNVGEYIEVFQAVSVPSTSIYAGYVDLTSLTLTAGDWEISGIVQMNTNTGSATLGSVVGLEFAIGGIAGNTFSDFVSPVNYVQSSAASTYPTSQSITVAIPPFRVKSDGTNKQYAVNSTSGQIMYAKATVQGRASGDVLIGASLVARRVR